MPTGGFVCETCERLSRWSKEASRYIDERTKELQEAGLSYEYDAFQKAMARCHDALNRCLEIQRLILEHTAAEHTRPGIRANLAPG